MQQSILTEGEEEEEEERAKQQQHRGRAGFHASIINTRQ